MTITQQKKFANELLQWHGGMESAVYAIGSCMLSDSYKRWKYKMKNHRGHNIKLRRRAFAELTTLRANANFPDAVTIDDERACDHLAVQLAFGRW